MPDFKLRERDPWKTCKKYVQYTYVCIKFSVVVRKLDSQELEFSSKTLAPN